MKTIALITIVCFISCVTKLEAQNKLTSNWHLGISYFGNNLWNPGAQITGQKLLFDKKKSRTNKKEEVKIKYRQIFLDVNLGAYYDNPTHWSVFNNYQINYRRVRKKGKYRSIGLGAGMLRNIFPETYSVDDQGNVSVVKNSGILYGYPVLTIGSGRLWKRRGTNPWRLQLHTFLLVNYNTKSVPLFNLEYGYLFGYKARKNVD